MNHLNDVTFTIPIQFESKDRVSNFKIVLAYLLKHIDARIFILESDTKARFYELIHEDLSARCWYKFYEVGKNVEFHRTKFLNIMAKGCSTQIIVNYDADVLLKPEQYAEAVELILSGKCDMCFPYDGKFRDIPERFHERIRRELSIDFLNPEECPPQAPKSVGGALLLDRKKFIEAGMENEYFISWGHEDKERIARFQKLGFTVGRVEQPLYHLVHQKTKGPAENVERQKNLYVKIARMGKEELKQEVSTWHWVDSNPDRIPKKLHYCWFGGEMDEQSKQCIEGWKKLMPDFELFQWDETNLPVQNAYVKMAIMNKKWANLSNFIRLEVLDRMGGIYFDTDVEVVRPFHPLLKNECFAGFQITGIKHGTLVNNAVFGACAGHWLAREMRDRLLRKFDALEGAQESSPQLITQVLMEKGLKDYDEHGKIVCGMKIYPVQYFYPYSWRGHFTPSCVKHDTYCIHHWAKRWEHR